MQHESWMAMRWLLLRVMGCLLCAMLWVFVFVLAGACFTV